MSETLSQLKRRAGVAAFNRHHILGHWKGDSKRAIAQCARCHMEVQVILNPAPNEIPISGEAVALNCRG